MNIVWPQNILGDLDEFKPFFSFIYFQGSEFSGSALWSRKVHRRQQPERIEIFIFSGLSLSRVAVSSGGFNIQNWVHFGQHYSDSVFLFLRYKIRQQTSLINVSAAILNLVRFSLFERCDSNKPETIRISILSGCCLWTLRDHKTLGDKNWDEFAM